MDNIVKIFITARSRQICRILHNVYFNYLIILHFFYIIITLFYGFLYKITFNLFYSVHSLQNNLDIFPMVTLYLI